MMISKISHTNSYKFYSPNKPSEKNIPNGASKPSQNEISRAYSDTNKGIFLAFRGKARRMFSKEEVDAIYKSNNTSLVRAYESYTKNYNELSKEAKASLEEYLRYNMPSTEEDAIYAYVTASGDINHRLRMNMPLPYREEKMVELLDSAIENSSTKISDINSDGFLYRGLPINITVAGKQINVADLKVDDIIEDASYLSTSPSKEVAASFAEAQSKDPFDLFSDESEGPILKIKPSNTTKMLNILNHQDACYKGEEEILLKRNLPLKVVEINGNEITVEAE